MFKKFIFLFILTVQFIFAAEYTFEQRQKLVQDIKSYVLIEELIASSIEKYIENNLALPSTLTDIEFSEENINSDIFDDYGIDLSNYDLVLNYSLLNAITDQSLINLYRSDSFRKSTFYNSSDNTIRVILSSAKAKHYYGLIKYQSSNILDCNISKVCQDNVNVKIKDGIPDTSNVLYEYEINNFDIGPMAINDDEALHSSSDFNLLPDGMILINSIGEKFIKDESGINKID